VSTILAPERLWRLHRAELARPLGKVSQVLGLALEVTRLVASIGDRCEVESGGAPLPAEVVGFRAGRLLLMPLGDLAGVRAGAPVRAGLGPLAVEVGDGLLGRVIDAFARPIDGGAPGPPGPRRPIHRRPPPVLDRRRIAEPLETGIRALDALLPLGRGQRIGIFAGSGVGKSILLGSLAQEKRVLDLGCDDGRGLLVLAEAGAAELVGVCADPAAAARLLEERGVEGVELLVPGAEGAAPAAFQFARQFIGLQVLGLDLVVGERDVALHQHALVAHDLVEQSEVALELGQATVRMSAERVDCQASRELALRAPSVQILAQRLVQVVDALATRAGRYELAARTVVERSEETVREVRGLLSTTAARLRLTAHELFEARSDRTVLRSDKETSIEAERILLG